MCGDRFNSSITCSRWRHETEPGQLDPSLSCRFWKVATHPAKGKAALYRKTGLLVAGEVADVIDTAGWKSRSIAEREERLIEWAAEEWAD